MHRFSNAHFRYNPKKNSILIKIRKISFDEIIAAILNGKTLAVSNHYNQEKYPNQKIAYVLVLDIVYVVPFIEESNGSIFLKTIYPSSKATKLYLQPNKETTLWHNQ